MKMKSKEDAAAAAMVSTRQRGSATSWLCITDRARLWSWFEVTYDQMGVGDPCEHWPSPTASVNN